MPAIVAPMFLVSTPEMVIEAARSGLIGAFPAPNARTVDDLDEWLSRISRALSGTETPAWAMNMIVHKTYSRFTEELELLRRYRPKLVITALGSPAAVVDAVHDYGGLVFADVITPALAKKALAAGADGLVLVCSGAGGHTGRYSPIAFVREVRSFFDGPLVAGGGIADAHGVLAVRALGADLAYMGTRFIVARESMAADAYREMLVRATMEGIFETRAITGVAANFLAESLTAAGHDLDRLAEAAGKVDFSGDIASDDSKAWRDVWGAGQGAGAVTRIEPLADIARGLVGDYRRLLSETRRGLGGAVSDAA